MGGGQSGDAGAPDSRIKAMMLGGSTDFFSVLTPWGSSTGAYRMPGAAGCAGPGLCLDDDLCRDATNTLVIFSPPRS